MNFTRTKVAASAGNLKCIGLPEYFQTYHFKRMNKINKCNDKSIRFQCCFQWTICEKYPITLHTHTHTHKEKNIEKKITECMRLPLLWIWKHYIYIYMHCNLQDNLVCCFELNCCIKRIFRYNIFEYNSEMGQYCHLFEDGTILIYYVHVRWLELAWYCNLQHWLTWSCIYSIPLFWPSVQSSFLILLLCISYLSPLLVDIFLLVLFFV